MPRIMTTCPRSGSAVPTGHRTGDVSLPSMIGSRSFRCPDCAEVHAWTAANATIEGPTIASRGSPWI